MMELNCELHRLRVTTAMRDAVYMAARREGISTAAWCRRVISLGLIDQLGGGWMRGEINNVDQVDSDSGVGTGDPGGSDGGS